MVRVALARPAGGAAGIWLAHLARIALGLVLLYAGLIKTADLSLFVDQIAAYEILPAWAPAMSRFFVVVEFGLGLALLANWRPRITIPATGGLMVFFIGVISWAWANGHTGPCGCFGSRGSKEPLGALLEDLLFVGLAVLAWWGLRRRRGDRPWQFAALLIGLALGASLPIVAANLPLDGLVTDARPGKPFDQLVVEGFDGDVQSGDYLFALIDPAAAASAAIVEPLNELVDADGLPEVVGLCQGSNDDLVAFMFEHDPYFELAYAPRAALRRFYRRLPVCLLVREGMIRQAWFDGVPTADQLRTVSESR